MRSNADVTDTTALGQRIADLGQPLYGKAGADRVSEHRRGVVELGRSARTDEFRDGAGRLVRFQGVKADVDRFGSKNAGRWPRELLGMRRRHRTRSRPSRKARG